ncbi:MAG: TIGR04086 family membrane protein [Clostridia bacterium]|nr:TIGR04086 family membrane protein [Clostridia bacterium]
MPKKRRTKPQVSGDIRTIAVKILIGSLVGVLLFFVLTALASFLLWKTDTDESVYKFVILSVGAFAAFAGGFVAVRPIRKNGIALGTLSTILPYFIVILVSALVAKSGMGAVGWILLPLQILFSAIGGIIAVNKRK